MNQSERSKGNQEGTRRRTRSSSLCPSKAFRVDDKLTKELKVPWKSFDSIFAIKIILIKHTDGFDRLVEPEVGGWTERAVSRGEAFPFHQHAGRREKITLQFMERGSKWACHRDESVGALFKA